MEATGRWIGITAIAPVAWGTNYYVTHQFLPPGTPLYGAAIRALPAGLLLLAIRPAVPRGEWWWKAAVLGTLNVGAFFTLIYVSAQLLPTSVASTVMAMSPIVMMLFAWALVRERPGVAHLIGATIGIAGVCVMLLTGASSVNPLGLLASCAAMAMSSFGFILSKRWSTGQDLLAVTSWQLIAGGLLILPFAIAFEGGPPTLSASSTFGFAYVTIVATAAAFAAWFAGLRHLDAGTVGLIGLLNPVSGVLLGTVLAGETLTAQQLCGILIVLVGIFIGQPIAARLTSMVTVEIRQFAYDRRAPVGPVAGAYDARRSYSPPRSTTSPVWSASQSTREAPVTGGTPRLPQRRLRRQLQRNIGAENQLAADVSSSTRLPPRT